MKLSPPRKGVNGNMKECPWYFSLNDRPVMVIDGKDGGLDVLGLDTHTGDFVRDWDAFLAYNEGGRDIDDLTKEEFDALVEKHRARIR